MTKKTKTTQRKTKKSSVRVGGKAYLSRFALWQKILVVIVFAGVVSAASIAVYSQMKERQLIAKAASYSKVDIHSNPKSSAGVTFSACKLLSGDNYTITILAVKSPKVSNASVAVKIYKKSGSVQSYASQVTAKSWWGGEVSALQLVSSKSKGDELVFTAVSKSGTSAPRYSTQPVRKSFKSTSAYQAALRDFQASTINPSSLTDCNKPAPNPVASSVCLSRSSSNKLFVSRLQKTRYSNGTIPKNTVIDASQAYWDGTDVNGKPISWTITVDGTGPACWYGGKFTGAWDDKSRSVTWSKDYHHAGAVTIRMDRFLVEGLRAHNQGDGIRMEAGGSNFHVKDVHLSDIHDDCVENDFLHTGTVESSLFDGCYSGISAATFEGIERNGVNDTWTFKNNLLRMKPFNTMFKPEKYGAYGHAMLFKGWYEPNRGPKLVLENNIFRADQKANIGDLQIPKNAELKSCKNNTFVWLGKGPFPYKLPSCFKITTDKKIWDNAVAAWKKQHPNVL